MLEEYKNSNVLTDGNMFKTTKEQTDVVIPYGFAAIGPSNLLPTIAGSESGGRRVGGSGAWVRHLTNT
jgi:hypothetical protein